MITKKNIFNNDNLARSISWKTNRQNWAKGTIYKEIWRPLLTLLNNLFSKLFPPANFLLVTRKHQQHSLLQHFIGPSVNLWKKCILLQKARSFMKMDRLQICFFLLIFISTTAGKTLGDVNGKGMHRYGTISPWVKMMLRAVASSAYCNTLHNQVRWWCMQYLSASYRSESD